MEKQLIIVKKEIYSINMEHLIVVESKELLKNNQVIFTMIGICQKDTEIPKAKFRAI